MDSKQLSRLEVPSNFGHSRYREVVEAVAEIYHKYEDPDELVDRVGQAHDDFLETLLELGWRQKVE